MRFALLVLLGLAACERPAPTPIASPAPPSAATSDTTGPETVVYVPAYSHIYVRDARRAINLATTLSIRNADPARAITLQSADYYDQSGRLLRRFVAGPVPLGALAAAEFVVEEDDTAGGAGASFLVTWRGDAADPVVEAVMIGSAGQQGISFVSPGRVVRRPAGS